MNWLAAICVKRPVFASVLVLVMLVFGIVGYVSLGVDQFPKVDFPTVTITTRQTGAAPENAASTAALYDPGDTITESTATFTQVTVALKRIIGDAEVDEFAEQTRSDQMDQAAAQIALKVRAVAEAFENLFISGDSAGNAKQFDGLRVLCTSGNSNRIGCGGDAIDGAVLTLDDMDALIDTVRGPVDLLIMSQRSKRKLKALFRASGASIESRVELGLPVDYYAGIPIATDESYTAKSPSYTAMLEKVKEKNPDAIYFASYLLDATRSAHVVEELALEHLGYKAIAEEDVCGRGSKALVLAGECYQKLGDTESRKRVCSVVQSMKLRHEAYALAQDFLDNYDPQCPGCAILEVRIPDVFYDMQKR